MKSVAIQFMQSEWVKRENGYSPRIRIVSNIDNEVMVEDSEYLHKALEFVNEYYPDDFEVKSIK